MLRHRHKSLCLSTEVVNVTGVNVEPECVNVQVMLFEAFLKEAIGCDVLKLLKCVDLREFVFDGEFVIGIDVSNKFPERRLGGECKWLV